MALDASTGRTVWQQSLGTPRRAWMRADFALLRPSERRPVLHRAALGRTLAPAHRDASLLRQTAINDRQQLAIDRRWRLDLFRRLMARMRLEDLVARQCAGHLTGQRPQGL